MQAPRASRISEAEWNSRRRKLENLYVDDDLSLQEVGERLAREDNFSPTEKQLKYQFKKWGLKKYITQRDLTAMLSFKRKREELGKNTAFEYRGHLIEEERLERASKRRKGSLISSPRLPSYIRLLVSPKQSPQMYQQTSAVPEGLEGVTHDSGELITPDFLSKNSFHQSGNSGWNDAFDSLGEFSAPVPLYDGEQTLIDGGLSDTLLDESTAAFSPGRQSPLPTPSGVDIQATAMENSTLSDINLHPDLSVSLNSPHKLSISPSSFHTALYHRRSVERLRASRPQLTDYENNQKDNIDFGIASRIHSTADQKVDLIVTGDDISAESILFLLLSLKSLVIPRFDIASQQFEDGNSILSDLFWPYRCELLCSEFEDLLELYVKRSLRSIRKRRTARIQSSLPSASNFNLNECRQSFDSSDVSQQVSNLNEDTVATTTQTTFFHRFSTPMGKVLFEGREEFKRPVGEERIDSTRLINISFMPHAMERTPGLCVRLFRVRNGPAIAPQIKTFNVVPDDSAIIQCVRRNDLKGIQTLFDLGAASARDVDSKGISLLYYAMFTGCSDVFRLLLQGGASTNECDDFFNRRTDIITVVWGTYAAANSSGLLGDWTGSSIEKVKRFDQCVAISQLALENNCKIDSANNQTLNAGPLFWLVGGYGSDVDASVLVDAIDYLFFIGWDLEEKNRRGQTPLLYAAEGCSPQIARCLRALLEKGAILDASDDDGRGPLLTALSPPLFFSDWVDLIYEDIDEEIVDNDWFLCNWFKTEDHRHIQDYYDMESIPDPLTNSASPGIYRSHPSHDHFEDSQLECDQESSFAAEIPMSSDLSTSDLQYDVPQGSEDIITDTEGDDYVYLIEDQGNEECEEHEADEQGEENEEHEEHDYVWCTGRYGHTHQIRNPKHVLKNRVKTKLKILLEAGCDPNEVDKKGESANDYARRGLWEQWIWALTMTGYVFDEKQNRWTKWFDPA